MVEIYTKICGATKLIDFDEYKLRFGNSNIPILHFLIHPVFHTQTVMYLFIYISVGYMKTFFLAPGIPFALLSAKEIFHHR